MNKKQFIQTISNWSTVITGTYFKSEPNKTPICNAMHTCTYVQATLE